MIENLDDYNLYRIVKRESSLAPKVNKLSTFGHILTTPEDAYKMTVNEFGLGYIPVLCQE